MKSKNDKLILDITKMVDDYFNEAVPDYSGFITKRSLKENIDSLICRNKNMDKRIKELEKISLMYQEDQQKAYKDALAIAQKEVTENLTIQKAIEMVSKMTIEQIIERNQYI